VSTFPLMCRVAVDFEEFAERCRELACEQERVARSAFVLERRLRYAQMARDTGRVIFGNILTAD